MGDVLVGCKAIADELDVAPRRVASLYELGAPIKRLGQGRGVRYIASRAGLQAWIRSSSTSRTFIL